VGTPLSRRQCLPTPAADRSMAVENNANGNNQRVHESQNGSIKRSLFFISKSATVFTLDIM
jgi:hypothetical protein